MHNERSAYYWPDRKRGAALVERLLGEVFLGILIVDGWHAYTKIVCDRQTCMAHIFRKVRAFIDAFPQYRSIMKFYLKLRQIIRDGEKLQAARKGLTELDFSAAVAGSGSKGWKRVAESGRTPMTRCRR